MRECMHENLVPMLFETYKVIRVNPILLRRNLLLLNVDDVIVVLYGNSSGGGCFKMTEWFWP